jgi:hypothetical protein
MEKKSVLRQFFDSLETVVSEEQEGIQNCFKLKPIYLLLLRDNQVEKGEERENMEIHGEKNDLVSFHFRPRFSFQFIYRPPHDPHDLFSHTSHKNDASNLRFISFKHVAPFIYKIHSSHRVSIFTFTDIHFCKI